MNKEASPIGWLRGALKLRSANQLMTKALARGAKYKNAIAPNLKNSVAKQYTEALKATSGAKQIMKQEAAGFFGAKDYISNLRNQLAMKMTGSAPIKRMPGRPIKDPKLKKGAPKQTAGRVDKNKGITTETTPTTGEPLSRKWHLKELAIGGAGGYLGGKLLGSSSSEPEYPIKYASIATPVKKLLRGVTKAIKNKYVIGSAVVGTGVGYGTARLADDGHDKSDHMPKKYAEEMTPKEKADQKYAIAKSYENEGHPKKSEEYKDKASRAYKRAWEKTHGKSK